MTSCSSLGVETGFEHPPHTASSEISVRAPWVVAEMASSVGICLENLTLNLGQVPLSQHRHF